MIKKYGIGLLAIVIAIGAAAFTLPHKGFKPLASSNFVYNSSVFTQAAVQTNSNWIPGTGSSCEAGESKACQMSVDNSYTHLVGSTRYLNDASSGGAILSIVAIKGPDNVNYQPETSSEITDEIPKP